MNTMDATKSIQIQMSLASPLITRAISEHLLAHVRIF